MATQDLFDSESLKDESSVIIDINKTRSSKDRGLVDNPINVNTRSSEDPISLDVPKTKNAAKPGKTCKCNQKLLRLSTDKPGYVVSFKEDAAKRDEDFKHTKYGLQYIRRKWPPAPYPSTSTSMRTFSPQSSIQDIWRKSCQCDTLRNEVAKILKQIHKIQFVPNQLLCPFCKEIGIRQSCNECIGILKNFVLSNSLECKCCPEKDALRLLLKKIINLCKKISNEEELRRYTRQLREPQPTYSRAVEITGFPPEITDFPPKRSSNQLAWYDKMKAKERKNAGENDDYIKKRGQIISDENVQLIKHTGTPIEVKKDEGDSRKDTIRISKDQGLKMGKGSSISIERGIKTRKGSSISKERSIKTKNGSNISKERAIKTGKDPNKVKNRKLSDGHAKSTGSPEYTEILRPPKLVLDEIPAMLLAHFANKKKDENKDKERERQKPKEKNIDKAKLATLIERGDSIKDRKSSCDISTNSSQLLQRDSKGTYYSHPKQMIKSNKIVPFRRQTLTEEKPQSKHVFKSRNKDLLSKKCDLRSGIKCEGSVGTGHFVYQLSDTKFIENGITQLPSLRSKLEVKIFKMTPAHPERNWFYRRRSFEKIYYDTNEILADIKDDGFGKWFYKSGEVALDYHKSGDDGFRYVVYDSTSDNNKCERKPSLTILASFDHLGNGIVYDHNGIVRLKYNRFEGQINDKKIGPPGRWEWHSLTGGVRMDLYEEQYDHIPVSKSLTPVALSLTNSTIRKSLEERLSTIEDTKLVRKKLAQSQRSAPQKSNSKVRESITSKYTDSQRNKKNIQANIDTRPVVERANEENKKPLDCKPFSIRLKIFKLNDQFSLHIHNQANIYLLFRNGRVSMKTELGLTTSKEIIKEIKELDEVGTPYDFDPDVPNKTDSMTYIKKVVQRTRQGMKRISKTLMPC